MPDDKEPKAALLVTADVKRPDNIPSAIWETMSAEKRAYVAALVESIVKSSEYAAIAAGRRDELAEFERVAWLEAADKGAESLDFVDKMHKVISMRRDDSLAMHAIKTEELNKAMWQISHEQQMQQREADRREAMELREADRRSNRRGLVFTQVMVIVAALIGLYGALKGH